MESAKTDICVKAGEKLIAQLLRSCCTSVSKVDPQIDGHSQSSSPWENPRSAILSLASPPVSLVVGPLSDGDDVALLES